MVLDTPDISGTAPRFCLIQIVLWLCILLTLGYPQPGVSAIFACTIGETVVYQDRPCPIKNNTPVKKTKSANGFPMNIHESWFEVPVQAEERAFCDRRSCECGNIEKRHQGTLVQAVADALFLDGSWHRYESGNAAWLEAPMNSEEAYLLRDQMAEASCEVMMSQVLLLNFAEDVLSILRARVNAAEERGYDIELPCQQGIAEACAYYQSVQLLARMKKDAASLQRDRSESMLPLAQSGEAADVTKQP